MSNYADSNHEEIAETFRFLADALEKGARITDDNMQRALFELRRGLDSVLVAAARDEAGLS